MRTVVSIFHSDIFISSHQVLEENWQHFVNCLSSPSCLAMVKGTLLLLTAVLQLMHHASLFASETPAAHRVDNHEQSHSGATDTPFSCNFSNSNGIGEEHIHVDFSSSIVDSGWYYFHTKFSFIIGWLSVAFLKSDSVSIDEF